MITQGTFPLSCFGGAGTNRNHVIASVFRELDLIEQRGNGVRRIFREAEKQGLPEPQIIEVGMRVVKSYPEIPPDCSSVPQRSNAG